MLASPSSLTLNHLRGPTAVSCRRSKPGASGTPAVSAAARLAASVLTAREGFGKLASSRFLPPPRRRVGVLLPDPPSGSSSPVPEGPFSVLPHCAKPQKNKFRFSSPTDSLSFPRVPRANHQDPACLQDSYYLTRCWANWLQQNPV